MNPFNKKNNLIQTYSLIIIDVMVVVCSYLVSYMVRYGTLNKFGQNGGLICLLLVLFCVMYALLLDWNHFIFKRGYFDELMAVLKYDVILLISLGFAVFIFKQSHVMSRILFGVFGIVLYILTYLSHILFKKLMVRFYRKSNGADKVLVVTESRFLTKVMEDIRGDQAWSYQITEIALLDEVDYEEYEGIHIIQCGEEIESALATIAMDEAFIYLPDSDSKVIEKYLDYFETMGVCCNLSVLDISRPVATQSVGSFAGHVVVTYSPNVIDYRRRLVKRVFDIMGAIVGIIITVVLTPFIALAIAIDSRGPIIFSQMRVGKNGRRFKMYKFRSMYKDAEERLKEYVDRNEMDGPMFKLENDPRITRVGKFIRKTSLDELPQFFNILKGDMSLIGTRPPTVDEFEQYSLHYRRRLSITPGLTGLWQVSGRSDITNFDDVVKLDLEYIDNWSLSLDFKILLQTIGVVLLRKGSK
ncbi:MAG: sugar transferase [Lachnospiraceae bacterium]|nr:sugar transferase [Candidatus Colinaster scatohippi]